MGHRQRYRLVDLERLCWRLQVGSLDEVRKNLAASLADKIARDDVKREPTWTESLAVGSRRFVEEVKPLILSRQEMEIVESAGDNVWALQEATIPYGQKTGPKNAPKIQNQVVFPRNHL